MAILTSVRLKAIPVVIGKANLVVWVSRPAGRDGTVFAAAELDDPAI